MIPHRQTSGRDGGPKRRRRGGRPWTVFAACALAAGMAGPARAQGLDGKVVAGSATIEQGVTRTTITAANNTIIDFPSFDIPAGHTVQFIQPSDTSRVLNRVTGGDPSELFGSLQANGIVYLANPAGIYFGPHAFIDVGALYAAAGNISNRDFLDQSNRFTGLTGSVVNAGLIRGRSVNLVGQTVGNLGVISAPEGTVVMAAGDDVYMGEKWGRVFVHATRTGATGAVGPGVGNAGTIDARGSQALLAAGDLYSVAIQQSGIIAARHVQVEGQAGGEVWNSGRIDATSAVAGETGGDVQITGEKVGLAAGSTIDASGSAGGGRILVGGDFQGKNPDVRNAAATAVAAGATLRADATSAGAGGRVIVWADDATRFHGQLSARGGAAGGDGGFAEVSGKQYLDFSGTVDLSALAGAVGSLLLDPRDLTIDNSTDNNTDGTGPTADPFMPTGAGSILTWGTLKAALIKGDVFVTTAGTGTTDPGDIVIAASPTGGYNAANDLSLTTAASGGIVVNGAITNAGAGNLTFNAGSNGITLNANLSFAAGTIAFNHAGALTQTAGTVTATTLTLAGNGAVGSSGNLVEANIAALKFSSKAGGDTFLANAHASAMTIEGSTSGALTLTATGAITQSALAVQIGGAAAFKTLNDAGAAIVLDATGNTFGSIGAQVRNAADDADVAAAITLVESGPTQLDLIRTGDDLSVTSTGAITQSAAARIGGTAAFKTRNDDGAAITLTNTGNTFGTVGGDVRNAADDDNAAAAIALVENDATKLGFVRTDGDLSVTSTGAITQSAAAQIGGAAAFKTRNDDGTAITLTNTGNTFGTVGADVRNAADDANATAAIALVENDATKLGLVRTDGDLSVTSTGAITQSTAASIGGAASFETINDAGAAITLDQTGNAFGTIKASTETTAGTVATAPIAMVEGNATRLAGVTTHGALSVTSAGTVDQTAAIVIGGAATLTVSTALSDIELASQDNSIAGATIFATSGTGTYRDIEFRNVSVGSFAPTLPTSLRNVTLEFPNAAVAVPSLTLTANLSVLAGGAITDATGTALTVAGLATFNAGANPITLGDSVGDSTNFGSLALTGGAVVVTEDSAMQLADVTATTSLNLTASGTIAQNTGSIVTASGPATFTVSAGSDLDLPEANVFDDSLAFATSAGAYRDLTFRNTSATPGALTLPASVTRDLGITFSDAAVTLPSLSVGGDLGVTAKGIANAAGATLAVTGRATFGAGGQGITLGQGGTDTVNFGTLAFTGGAVTIAEDSSMALAAASGGTVSLTANGSLTQSGVLTATGATTLTVASGGDLLLGSLANDVRGAVNFGVLGAGAIRDLKFRTISSTASLGGALPTDPRDVVLTFDAAPLTLTALAPTGSVAVTAGGLLTLSGNIATVNQSVALTGSSVKLPAAFSLTTGGGAVTVTGPVQTTGTASITTAGGKLAFTDAINDAVAATSDLTLNAGTGEVALGGAIGGSVKINSLAATGSSISIHSVASSAGQSYTGPITLLGNSTLDGSTLSFGGALAGAGFDLTLVSSATKSLGASFTGIRDLTASGAGTTELGGALTTSGTQVYNSPVSLVADTTLSATTFTFGGTVTGAAHALTLNHAVNTTFDLATFTGLAAFTVGSSAISPAPTPTTTLGGTMTATGNLVFNNPVRLTGATGLTGALTEFLATVDGGEALTIAGPAALAGSVGGGTPLASIAITGAATLNSGASLVKTTGAQTFSSSVILNTNTHLDSGAGVTVGAVTGNHHTLTIDAGATVAVNSSFSGLDALSVTAPQANLSGTIATTDGQTFDANIVLTGDTTLTSSADQDITIDGTVDGAHTLTVNLGAGATPGTVAFGQDLGAITPLASLTVTGAGRARFAGEKVKTSGDQGYGGLVTATTAGGGIAFSGATGTFTGGIGAPGIDVTLTFAGLDYQPSTLSLGSLAVTTTAKASLSGANPLLTTGAQTYTGAVELADGAELSGGSLTFNDSLKLLGSGDLTTTSGGLAVTGAFTAIGTANLTATGVISLGSTAAFDGGGGLKAGPSATVAGRVTIGTGKLLDITATATTFNGRVLGPGGLVVHGASRFNGFVGYDAALPFDALSSLNVTGDTVIAADPLSTSGAAFVTGTETFGGKVTLLGTTYFDGTSATFNGAVEGPGELRTYDDAMPVTFNGSVGGTVPLNLLDVGAATLNGSLIRTTLSQNYAGTVTIGGDVTLKAGSLTTAAVEGTHNLTLDVTGAASIGPVTGLGSGSGTAITIDSSGATTFTGAVGTATGIVQTSDSTVTFADDVTIGSGGPDTRFDGSVTFNGGQFLSGGAVTFGDTSADTLVIGNSGGAVVTTATAGRAVTIHAAATLNGALAIDTGAGGLSLGPMDGGHALTLTSSDGITFANTMGATTALASLTVNGDAGLNGAAVRTSGAQNYNGALTLGADATLSVLNPGSAQITLGGAIDGAHALTLVAPTVHLAGAVGSGVPLSSLTVTAGATTMAASRIATWGDQIYSGPVNVTGTTELATTTGRAAFGGAVEGPGALTITGQAAFADAVGATTPLASLTITGAAALDGGSIRTTGTQRYSGATTFANDLHLTGSEVTIDTAINSAQALTITGDAAFGGAIGQSTPLSLLSVSGRAGLQGGSVTTVGAQTYAGEVTLTGNTTLTGSLIAIDGAVDGGFALELAGDATFGGLIGDVAPLLSLTVTGKTTLAAPRITTSTTQTYAGPVSLGGDTTLKGSLVTIDGPLDGSLALTLDGNAALNGSMGQTTPLAALTVTGTSALTGGQIATTGAQFYGGATTLGAATQLNGAAIEFGGTLDGAFALATSGATTFDGMVGGGVPLASLAVDGPATFNTGAITTTGNQTYAGAATLGSDTILATGTGIVFNGTLDGANALAISGDAAFAGAVGATTALTSLDISGASTLEGATVRTTAGQTYTGATTLGGDSTLTGTLLAFGSTLDGAHALTLTGDASFAGPVGSSAPLTSLSVSGSSQLNAASIVTTGGQTYAGPFTLGHDSTLTGSTVSLGGSLDGPFAFAIAGDAVFGGAVGAGSPLASLTVSGSSSLGGGTVSTTGTQTYAGAATLDGDTMLKGTTVTLGSSVDGPFALTIDGAVNFGGAVGGVAPLGELTVNGAIGLNSGIITTQGNQTYNGAVSLISDSALTASAVRFFGTVDGPFALTLQSGGVFGGVVGGVQPLAALNVAGPVGLDNARITTTGGQAYAGVTTLTGDSVLTGSLVRFGGAVDGAGALAIAGDASFAGSIGDAAAPTALTITGDTALAGARVSTVSLQSYGGAVTLAHDARLSSPILTFGGAIDGAYLLTLDGVAAVCGPVGAGTPRAGLVSHGATTLATTGIATTGAQTFDGAFTLGADATLTGSLITFTGAVDGAQALAVAGNAAFEGAVGQTTPLRSLAVSGDAALDGGAYTTTGGQQFGGAVTLGADTSLTAESVRFAGALDGAHALVVNGHTGDSSLAHAAALGDPTVRFDGAVGNSQALASLVVNGTGAIGGSSVTTSGAQRWNGAVTLDADVKLGATNVTFAQTVEGEKNLEIAGDVVLDGLIGGVSPLAAFSVSGATQFDAGGVATTGAQTYGGAVTLGTDVALTASAGSITFNGAIGSPSNAALTVAAPTGFVAFYAGIGLNGETLGSLSVEADDMEIPEVVTTGNQSYGSAAGAVTMLTGNLRSENGDIGFSSRRSEVPAIATIFKNTPGDLLIEAPKGNFSMTSYERFLVSGGRTAADEGGSLTLNVGGQAALGDFAVSKLLTVRANALSFEGTYLQATDILLLTPGGTLMPASAMTFQQAATGRAPISLSTRNATPFAPTLPELIFRRLDPALFSGTRINPDKFPVVTETGSILFTEFNVFPVFAASSRTNLSEVLSGATPVATATVAQVASISSAVRDQLVLLGIFARRLTPDERAARRENRTLYTQIIPTEVREPDMFQVADGRISQDGSVAAVRLYRKIFMTQDAAGAAISRIPEIQQSLATAFRAFRRSAPNADPGAFAAFLRDHPDAAGVAAVRDFVENAARLFHTIESLGLTAQEIAVSKTVLLRPLRVVGLPSATLRRMIESLPPPAMPPARLASTFIP
jgi:filamentous hemagglutinin family protein